MMLLELLAFGGKFLEAPMLRSESRAQQRTGSHCGHRNRKGSKRDMRRDGRVANVGGQIANRRRTRARL